MNAFAVLELGEQFRRLERWLPRRLTTRVTLAVVIIVVMAGFVTTGAINQVLVRHLRAELIASGEALSMALGENLANALVEGDLASVQEGLNSAVTNNPDVVYAFAFGPNTPVIHTFPDGFPAELLQMIPAPEGRPGEGILLRTEMGLVRDFGYRPLDGFPAEFHIGISQARIGAVQRQVTGFLISLTLAGCLIAAAVAYGFSRLATYPLVELTRRVQRLGRGHLDERIDLPPGDEVGDLAQAFNQMATDIQSAILRLQVSEAGYRDLLTAASTVGEGIALICDEGPDEGTFLFVNETFARLAGFRPAEMVGLNAASVLHPASLSAARRAWQAIRDGTAQTPYELTLVDRHGRSHILETAGTLIEYQNRRALAWFTRDISQRKAREEELRRRNRELTALNAVASAVSNPVPADEMLDRALRQALAALDLEIGWIFVLAEEGHPRLAASCGLMIPDQVSFDFPDCRCGVVLTENRPLIVDATEPRCTIRCLVSDTNRPPTCHAAVPVQARGRTLGVLSVAATGAQTFGEADLALLAAVGQQIGVALENARLWEELRRREQVRGELLAQVIRAQEEERRRIARELHDGIGQSLNALVFGLNTVSTALKQAPGVALELMGRLKVSASDTVRELQEVIYDLRPSLLDDLGLCLALRWYAQERLQRRGIRVVLDVPDEMRRLPSEVETALFRIGQEAITNVSKHAQAHEVHIRLRIEPHQARMEVQDDGIGFSPNMGWTADKGRRAWGLLGMRERAALLGGELSVESEPGRGTCLRVILPLGGEEE